MTPLLRATLAAALAATALAAAPGTGAAAAPRWGAYNGSSTSADNALATMVRDTPQVGVSYYQASRTGVAQVDRDRVAKGIKPAITVATKNYLSTGHFMLWPDIAAGRYDAYWRAWGQSLASLKAPVMFTFDQEPDARINHHWVPAADTTAAYRAAYRRIHNLIEPIAPNVQWSFWVGGSDKAKITAAYPGDAYIDRIGYDPYKWSWHPAAETPIQTWKPFLDWLNAQSWGRSKPRALFETGVDIGHFGQTNAAAWWAKTPAAAATLGLDFFVLFNRVQWTINGKTTVINAYSTAMKTL